MMSKYHNNLRVSALLLVTMLTGCQDASVDNNITDLSVSFDPAVQQYQLHWKASAPQEPVSIQVSEQADGVSPKVLTQSMHGSEYTWKTEQPTNRYYFTVVPKKGTAATLSSRWLPLQGGKNFRDLGGYTTVDGRQVRWGKLFRTGSLNELTDVDYQELHEIPIATVVDFRTRPERESQPTHWQGEGTELLSWDYDLGMDTFAQVFMDPQVTPEKVEAAMAAKYPQMLVHLKEQYTTMFDRLAASDKGMIFHCTAGKDRTGIAAALILTVLGVDKATIEQDFMLSDTYYMTMTDPRRALGGAEAQAMQGSQVAEDPRMAMMAKLPKELMLPVMGVRLSYIQTVMGYMEQESGSVMNYIQQNLGVDEQKVQQIRENFLQNAVTL